MSDDDAKKPEVENLAVEIMRDIYDGIRKEDSELTKTAEGAAMWDTIVADGDDDGAVSIPNEFPDLSDATFHPLVEPKDEESGG